MINEVPQLSLFMINNLFIFLSLIIETFLFAYLPMSFMI